MKTTTLVFTSFEDLWEFKQMTNTLNCIVNTELMLISAEFNEAQVQLAVSTFQATVKEDKVA